MRKVKYVIPVVILLLIHLLVFIGIAGWMIPSYKESEPIEDITGLVNKYLGGQSVTENESAQWPISKDESVIATPDYDNTWFKAGNLSSWTKSAPSTPGQYSVRYIINGKEYIVDFTINSATAVYVAYINNNTDGYRYTSIESALNAATSGDTVWVIVRGEPTYIKSNCTIKEGVTLNIPYGTPNSSILAKEDANRIYTLVHNNQQAPSHTNEATYLKNEVIISSGVTLTNNGTLNIGGVVSGGGGGTASGYNASGYTDTGETNDAAFINGDYAQISLNSSSNIISNGNINCYGYIIDIYSENVSTINNSIRPKITLNYGELNIPFVVVENRGGTRFANMAGGITKYIGQVLGEINLDLDYAPFSRFYVQNIPCLIDIKYGASIIGLGNLYGNSQDNSTDVTLISPATNSMIQTKSGGYIICSSIINRDASKDNGASVLNIDIYGGCAVNGLTMTITADLPVLGTKNINISTKDILLPISWQYNISFNGGGASGEYSASYELNHDIKLLPGAKLVISENATVNGGSYNLVVYNNNKINTSSGNQSIEYDEYQIQADRYTGKTINGIDANYAYLIDTASPFYYPNDKGVASLIVNGDLNVNKLGGLVETQNTGAMISFKSNYVESLELISIGTFTTNADSTITYAGPSATDATSKSQDYGSYLTLKLYEGTDKTPIISGGSSGSYTYYSKEGYWTQNKDFNIYTVNYDNNNIGVKQSTVVLKLTSNTYTLTSDDLPILNQYHYMFNGWYTDTTYSTKYNVGDPISPGTITLYAKWEPINYTIFYSITTQAGVENPGIDNTNIDTINIEKIKNGVSNSLFDLAYTGNDAIFGGWYLDSTTTSYKITSITEESLEYLDNNILYVYGIWNEPVETIYKVYIHMLGTNGTTWTTLDPITRKSLNTYISFHHDIYNETSNLTSGGDYFVGWYKDQTFNDKYSYDNGNITLSKTNGETVVDGESTYVKFDIYCKLLTKYSITYATIASINSNGVKSYDTALETVYVGQGMSHTLLNYNDYVSEITNKDYFNASEGRGNGKHYVLNETTGGWNYEDDILSNITNDIYISPKYNAQSYYLSYTTNSHSITTDKITVKSGSTSIQNGNEIYIGESLSISVTCYRSCSYKVYSYVYDTATYTTKKISLSWGQGSTSQDVSGNVSIHT